MSAPTPDLGPIPAIRQDAIRIGQMLGADAADFEWVSVKYRGMDPLKIEAASSESPPLPSKMTRYEVAILQTLRDADEPLQQKEICRRTRICRTNVVKSLKFLARRGLVANEGEGYTTT